ncbi:Plscr3 [Symbiodinium sp. CCMP2592]|nr:Plscr3 [Symbiodinium sp. CCMP2592]
MAKLSPDYVFSLLKSMNEAERAHFLKRMEGDPLLPSTTPAPALAAAPSEQPASSTVIDPIGDSIAAEDYGPPAASKSSPSPPAPTLEAPAEPEPKAATGGQSAPTEATSAAQGDGAKADATGDGVTNAKRWQREPEVKEPPPRPPSSPALASQTPKAGVPLLKSKSMATPTPPASAPPPPLVEEGTTGGSSGNTGQQPPTSTPQREIAPLLASDAPASRLGHTIYDSEGGHFTVEPWPRRVGPEPDRLGGVARLELMELVWTGMAAPVKSTLPPTFQASALNRPLLGRPNLYTGDPAGLVSPLELGFRKPVISSTASRLENRRQAPTAASKCASACDSLRNMTSFISPAWVKRSPFPLGTIISAVHASDFFTSRFTLAVHPAQAPLDMSDFSQFVSDCNVPAAVASLLSEFDTALYARACTTPSELEELITHFMTEAAVTEAAERFITKASLRLLFSKCRQSEGMASLEATPSSSLPLGEAPSTAVPPAPAAVPLSSSWQEAWPAKLSGERTAALRKRFEEDYPTELLDAESFPSARLLALTNKMLSEKEVRWIPWKYRLSARAQEDSLLIRPKKQARFDIAEFFFDEAPTRDIHEGPASFSFVTQLLSLAANAIALCQGAHLGSLKLYNKKFTRICFTKYEASANLRGPTTMEAQAADRRCWEIIADLVNVHHWKLDDALHEVAEVRSDLHSLLAPRPFVPKPKHDPDNSWKTGAKGNGRGGKGGGRGGKGRDGKGEKGERFERGGKGGKGKDNKQATPPGKWLSTIFMDGKRQTLCMRYQSGQCKDPATFSRGNIGTAKAGAPVSSASLAISEGSLDFATCLELLAQYFSLPFIDAAGPTDNAIDASGAYFNLGAFSFDNGTRSGIFQRTEQFSDVLRFLNAFMQLQFPGASWSSLCVSHNVRTRLHTDAGNASGTLNHTVSLGNFSGGEIWISPALDPSAANIPAPLEASSEAHRAEDASKGELRDTWHSPLSFSCESLHCTMPIQGDRWVLTAYTCRNLHSFDMKSLAHLKSLGFPLPTVPTALPQALPSAPKDNTHVEIFLDICCGASHPLTTAISSCGIMCLPIDLLGEEQLDLLHDDTYDHLLRLCFSGIVRFAHGSPPCKEYSRLKLRPGGPAAIRSPEHLNGLPGNTASQQERVLNSQKLLYRCVCLLRAAFNSGAHVSLEQPTNAMSWLEPFVQDMLAEIQASLVNIPACSVGQNIAKSWLFACSFDDMQALAGTCSHSEGHPSVAGVRDELGNFLSQRTAEYPAELANSFAQQAAKLFSSCRPSHSVPTCSLAFALASIPKKPRAATTTASQDGGGIYSLPDWSMGPRYQSDSLHDLRKEWQSWLLSHRIPLRLQQHVAAGSNSPLFSEEETSWLRGSFKRFSDAHSPARDWDFSVQEGQPYCLSALERLSTLLGDKDTTLFPALQKGVPTGFDGDIPRSHTLRPRSAEETESAADLLICEGNWQGIHTYLDDKLRFTGTPPGTSISEGSTLLSARHKTLHSKQDLALVPVSTKRMWLRVTDPTSSKRRLSEASRETLSCFAHLSSREWRPRPLRPPPTSSVESAADAFGKGNNCGVGGWLRLPCGRLLWFSHRYTVQDFLELGLPMQPDANLDISSYETLAQCYVLLAFWKAHGSGRLALTLPALSDNSGAESVCNKLYTSKVPLNLFVRKLSMWSSITGVTLDCSHIAGEKNDDADLLSRWDGSAELPAKFLPSNRIELYLSEFWQIRFQVKLFPSDTFLKWQLPSATRLGPTNRGSTKRK